MQEKKLVDKIRESSGQTEIGTDEDGAILEMKNYNGKVIIIKEKAIYELVFADDIDPERTNENLSPTINKLIVNKGAESKIVSKTFITAKTLFNNDHIMQSISAEKLISLSLNLLEELNMLNIEVENFRNLQQTEIKNYEERKEIKSSFQLPNITELESKCKTIFQKADHAEQILMEIITNFYPNEKLTKQSHFPKFHEVIKIKYGENDTFTKFIYNTLNFMKAVRELRNGFDHRLQTVKATNFELLQNGNINTPTIELNHKEIQINRTELLEFLDNMEYNFLHITENLFAFLAEKNKRNDRLPISVKEIPEDIRRYKFAKYCFWSPIGEDGHYMQ